MMDDVTAEKLQDLKDSLAELSPEERLEVFADLEELYCLSCGDIQPCYCDPEYDE